MFITNILLGLRSRCFDFVKLWRFRKIENWLNKRMSKVQNVDAISEDFKSYNGLGFNHGKKNEKTAKIENQKSTLSNYGIAKS
jgi:hypothetical protein